MSRIRLIWPLYAAIATAGIAQVVDIGSRREIFVDRHLIAELKGSSLRLHEPRLAPPVTPPRPDGHYATVLHDRGVFRFYYRGEKVPGTGWKTDG